MQNKFIKKFLITTIIPFVMAIFVIMGAVVTKNSTIFAVGEDNPIKVSLVTVFDKVPDNYDSNTNTPSIIDSSKQRKYVSYAEGNVPFVLVDNSYEELEGNYEIVRQNNAVIGVKLDGETYTYDSTGKIKIKEAHYFYNSTENKIYKYQGFHQAVQIQIGDENTAYYIDSLSITLNGTTQILKNEYSGGGTSVSQTFQTILHGLSKSFLDDSKLGTNGDTGYFYTKDTNDTPIEYVEGKYVVELSYRDNVGTPISAKFEFYLITTNSYANKNESVKFDNTQKVETEDEEVYGLKHYFNQTNKNTTLSDGTLFDSTKTQSLAFPTVHFNPEKYKLTYKRSLYSTIEYGEFVLKNENNMIATLTEIITRNNVVVSSKSKLIARQTAELEGVSNLTLSGSFVEFDYKGTHYSFTGTQDIDGITYYYNSISKKICVYDENAKFNATWIFEKLGDYEFYKMCQIRTSYNNDENDYTVASNITLSNTKLLKTEALFNNGFQATYAKNGNTTDYLRNEEYNSDYTYLNNNIINTYSGSYIITRPNASDVFVDESAKLVKIGSKTLSYANNIASTNQPQVKLEYNAVLNPSENSKWYIYKNSEGKISVNKFDYSTVFEDAGTYYVYVTFKNNSSQNTSYTCQFLAFNINNTQPNILVQTTKTPSTLVDTNGLTNFDDDTINLNNGEYTNQKLYVRWDAPTAFNAEISAVYSVDYYETGLTVNNVPLIGVETYTKNGLTYSKNISPTIFTENGHYTLKIYYTNSKKSFFVKTFTIDNAKISGIKALAVNTNAKTLENIGENSTFSSNIISQFEENKFNLTTNKNYAWTWNRKLSGAEITAKYYSSDISYITNFKTNFVSNSAGQTWILANGKFSELSTAKNYAYTEINEKNFKTINLLPSQIISSDSLSVLVLEDEAGNKAVFVTILDGIKPEYIMQENGEGENITSNLIAKTTKLTWGTHKTLSIKESEDHSEENTKDIISLYNNLSSWTFNGTIFDVDKVISTAMQENFSISKENKLFYTLKINNIQFGFSGETTHTIVPTENSTESTAVWVVVEKTTPNSEGYVPYYTYLSTDYNKNTGSGTPLADKKLLVSNGKDTMTERVLTLNIFDKLNNQKRAVKRVSLDKSQGSMFSHTATIDNTDVTDQTDELDYTNLDNPLNANINRKQLFNNNSTNRDYVTFSFLQQLSGGFEVAKITLDFYDLNFDKNSKNYPYSNTAYTVVLYPSDIWNTFNKVNGDGIYHHSNALREIARQSASGMYVITREYGDAFNDLSKEAREGDIQKLSYTCFVDRTKIISKNSNEKYTTGEDILLKFGLDDYGNTYQNEKAKIFKDFEKQIEIEGEFSNFKMKRFESAITSPSYYAVSSNILPTNIALDLINSIAYKYKYKDNDNYVFSEINANMNLAVVVQQFNSQAKLTSNSLYTSGATISNNETKVYPLTELSAKSFNVVGTYRVMIVDLSNITGSLSGNWNDLEIWQFAKFAPNYTIFSFEIRNVKPSASAVVSGANNSFSTLPISYSIATENITESYYITKNDRTILTFSDTNDDYLAKIAYNDVALTRSIYSLNTFGTLALENSVSIQLSNARIWDESSDNKELFSDDEIARINGGLSKNNAFTLSTKSKDGGILYYKTQIAGTDRFNYYIILPSTENAKDAIYRLDYHYLGNRNDYKSITNNQDGTSIESYSSYEGYTKLYVDHTAPYKNLVDLVNADSYLSAEEKAEIFANLNNPDHELLQKYAFAVNASFKLTDYGDAENGLIFYYTKHDKLTFDENGFITEQTSVPGSEKYNKSENRFVEIKFTSMYYSNFPSEAGYYDIIEIDKAGNYRVYTIYLNTSSADVTAEATDANSSAKQTTNIYNFASYYDGVNPVYKIDATVDGLASKTIFKAEGITTNTQAIISAYSFKFLALDMKDSWYNIDYRIQDGVSTNKWEKSINISPTTSTENAMKTLNDFIAATIELRKNLNGAKIEIIIKNRAGNDISFFLLTPGKALEISDLLPRDTSSSFNITIPADTFSTQFSNFVVKLNGTTQQTNDSRGKSLSTLETNRNNAQDFTFSTTNSARYTFEWVDNFNKKYYFVYPRTANLYNELEFAEGAIKYIYEGVYHTSSTTKFVYRPSSSEKLSLKITDKQTNEVLVNFEDLLYSNPTETVKVPRDLFAASQMFGDYFSLEKVGTTVTLTFPAKNNIYYNYEIKFTDIDNNTSTHNFAMYTFAPKITLTDVNNIPIWGSDVTERVTSKNVYIKWETEELLFTPTIYLNSKEINSPYTVTQEGTYTITVKSALGTINHLTTTFTIKPATTNPYTVYFENSRLNPHCERMKYIIAGETYYLDHYFFLSSNTQDWSKIAIVSNENKNLKQDPNVIEDGNTKIYHLTGISDDIYFAVTRIHPSDTVTSYFGIHTYTDGNTQPSSSSVISNLNSSYLITLDASRNPTYAQLRWTKAFSDTTNNKTYDDFIYLEAYYNNIYMGKFTSGTLNLTKSGTYTIHIRDIVGQEHKFNGASSFELTILNDIIFYVNGGSPIQDATYNTNTNVVISLPSGQRNFYNWASTGSITVLKNNTQYTSYQTISNTSWSFSETGYYRVTLQVLTTTQNPCIITAVYNFNIIDENESKQVYEFTNISGYVVEKVEYLDYGNISGTKIEEGLSEIKNNFNTLNGDNFTSAVINALKAALSGHYSGDDLNQIIATISTNLNKDFADYQSFEKEFITQLSRYIEIYKLVDVTQQLKALNNVSVLENFSLSPDTIGDGKYKITIKVRQRDLVPEQTYSFVVWVNNVVPIIQSSREFGSSSTKPVTISYNASLLYEQVGNCYISVNGQIMAEINSSRKDENQISTFTFSEAGTYLVQVYSQSGTILSSQRITINVPLNTAAIILIVVGCVVVVGIITIFIVLRTRMKVK